MAKKKPVKKPPVSDSEVSPSSIEQSNQNSPPPDSAPLTKNFFKYGREHFSLDRQIDYQLEEVADTTRVTNPAWRKLDSEVRKRVSRQVRRKAKLHEIGIILTPSRKPPRSGVLTLFPDHFSAQLIATYVHRGS